VNGQSARGSTAGAKNLQPTTQVDSKAQQTRLAIRIVLHLTRFGLPREDGYGRPEATQDGIAREMSTTQGAVSKILVRLSAAEAVRSEHRHVIGFGRRVRVYSLTRRGELLAEELGAIVAPDNLASRSG
jgi:DNA-binding MarR family transcriptional regulator